MRSALLSAFVLGALAWGNAANADVVSVTASGNPNVDADYWTIAYDSGGSSIVSVSIDLSPVNNSSFDFDGSGNYFGATGPVILLPTNGVTSITPVFVGTNPAVLKFTFLPGAFTPGESFQFAADWDGGFWGDGGEALLHGPAIATFVLSDGKVYSGGFAAAGTATSRATMPEPGLLAMAGLSLFGAVMRRRRRNAA